MELQSNEKITSQELLDLIGMEIEEGFNLLNEAKEVLDNVDFKRMIDCANGVFLSEKRKTEKVIS